jgi:ketosteroid isomerase-like protein
LFACQPSQPTIDELFNADREFSIAAGEMGFNKAFIEFAHTDAVLLRENSMPIVGKNTITKLFEKSNAEGVDFSWEPLGGDIAQSGELGYTYGTYTLKQDTIVQKGTYISVWKKDKNNEWKYVLDSGNEGLGK